MTLKLSTNKKQKRLQYILGHKSLSYEDITQRLSFLSMHEQKSIINEAKVHDKWDGTKII